MTAFVNNVFDESYALTEGRDAHINIPAGGNAVNWKPARDIARYYGVRASCHFLERMHRSCGLDRSASALALGIGHFAHRRRAPPRRLVQPDRREPHPAAARAAAAATGERRTRDANRRQPVFNGADKFLPGKIALAFADLIAALPADDPRLAQVARGLSAHRQTDRRRRQRQLGHLLLPVGPRRARARGHAAGALDPLTLAKLERAARLAQLRRSRQLHAHRASQQLLLRGLRDRAAAPSAGLGRGRRRRPLVRRDDRALPRVLGAVRLCRRDARARADSIATACCSRGEIAQRFMETGEMPPPEIVDWVRKSADVMLMRLNSRGEGFEYGRSLGPTAKRRSSK